MIIITIIYYFSASKVYGDTSLVSSSAPIFSSASSPDSSYYDTDPYAGYDYGAGYTSFLQGEEDRQDVGLLGGLSVAVIGTVFLAALLGALVAPALSEGMARVMDLEIDIPEIEFPKFSENTIEDDIEIIEDRSMNPKFPWMKIAKDALSLLEHKLARHSTQI